MKQFFIVNIHVLSIILVSIDKLAVYFKLYFKMNCSEHILFYIIKKVKINKQIIIYLLIFI